MYFESYKSILYSDTLVPDIFISEYMPSMDGNCTKVYLYCLFLSKYNKKVSAEEIAKAIGIDASKVRDALIYLSNVGIISWKEDHVLINDIKEKEIKKIYRLKTTSSPEEAVHSSERNKRRNCIITAINNNFFQGVMAPSWYTDIDAWFDRYRFDEDVMYALFQHCYNHKGLSKQYIVKVADSWSSKGIKNSFDLDAYSIEYQKFKEVKLKIVKKLKRKDFLTEYEDEYIEKWVMDYKYDFDIIDLALKKTTAISRPSFDYVNKILATWHEKGLRTKEDIIAYEREQKQNSPRQSKAPASSVPQHDNFQQRKYDDDFYNSFFDNLAK
ncbi:MAG: DnaD domain protein [Clostridia bacterium]|nr:DnaD domain protein [Clostridia bacterium]